MSIKFNPIRRILYAIYQKLNTGTAITGNVGILNATNVRINPATEETQSAGNSILGNILTQLQNQKDFEETVWIDTGNSNTVYIRTVTLNEGTGVKTITYSLPDGTTYLPVGPSVQASSSNDVEFSRNQYKANAGGTGYTTGNVISQILVLDTTTTTPSLRATLWYNESTLAFISTPTPGTLDPFEGNTTVSNPFALEATQLLVKSNTDNLTNWNESNRAKVNLIAGQAGIDGGPGAATTKTARVVLSDNVPSALGVNSSTTNLGSNAVFTGTSESTVGYKEIRIYVFSNVASATDGLSIQQSSDGTNWDIVDTYTISAGVGKTIGVPRQGIFFRIVYTNGASAQTSFRLQVVYDRVGGKSSSQKPMDAYSNETDLEQSQAFLMGFNGTTWDRLRLDSGFRLTIADTTTSAFSNGTATAVSSTAVQILAANVLRKGAVIQNQGNANVRIGITGVTAATGIRLGPGKSIVIRPPNIETSAIFAIREGATDSTVLAQEST